MRVHHKIIIAFIITLLMSSMSYATTAFYRISSGEVLAISVNDDPFTSAISTPFAVIDNATYPDGTECMDSKGDLRILGTAKILDGTVIRNATAPEIITFSSASLDDGNQIDADKAIAYLKNHKQFRKIMAAFSAIIVSELNILRAEHGLPDRTLQQLQTAIENRISKDD